MSATNISKSFPIANMLDFSVGRDISGSIGRFVASSLATLQMGIGVGFQVIPRDSSGSNATIVLPYSKTKGINALYVSVEISSNTDDATCYVDLNETLLQNNGLDGATILQGANRSRNYQRYDSTVDVSGFTVGSIHTITINRTAISAVNTGIAVVTLNEVPRASYDPTNGDPGILPSWCQPGGYLQAKTSSDSYGFARVASCYEDARKHFRMHIVWAKTQESPWNTTSTSYVGFFATTPKYIYFRVRRLFETSVANTHTIFLRYSSDQSATFKFTINGGTPITKTYGSTGSVWTTDSSQEIDIPTNGTDQEIELLIEYKLASAGSIDVATLAFIEKGA